MRTHIFSVAGSLSSDNKGLLSKAPKVMNSHQSGFSLVELVITIVIMSIISVGLIQFIANATQSYIDTSTRNQISASGRIVLDRIGMELRNALPNSIRISSAYTAASTQVLAGNASAGDQCIEFVPVTAASSYIDAPFGGASSNVDAVEFIPEQTSGSGLYAVIYPTKATQIYQQPVPSRGPRAAIQSIAHDGSLDVDHITLSAAHRFKRRSRSNRIFITQQPVSICIKNDRIYRYSNYDFNSTQLRPVNIGGACGASDCLPDSTPNRVVISSSLENSGLVGFDQVAPSRRRNAVVQVELNFSDKGESVRMNHEVLLRSTP